MKVDFKQGIITLSFAAVLVLSGCGGSSTTTTPNTNVPTDSNPDGDNSSGDTTTSEVSYKGERSVGGSIESFGTSLQVNSSDAPNPDEIVKLYVLDEKGELKDTEVICSITDNSYTCPNVAGNKEYIVRYMKKVGNGKVLEMKSNVTIAQTDITDAKVDRVSSLIVDTITKAVEEALVGVALTEDKVKALVGNVKNAISSSFAALVEDGLVEIPSQDDMVISLEDDETFEQFTGKIKENDKLSDSSGVILTDEGVSKTLQANKNVAKAESYFANLSKKELVEEIFNQTGDDGAPDWVIEFLADKYDTKAYTIGQFQNKLTFEFESSEDGTWNPDEWFVAELEHIGIAEEDQEGLVTDILNTINNQISSGEVLGNMKALLLEFYALKNKENKTADEIAKIADFPPIIAYLFSQQFATSMSVDTEFENMGQAIVYVMFVEQVAVKEVQKNKLETYLRAKEKPLFEDKLEQIRLVEVDPFFIFQDLEFALGGDYDTLSINWFEARTDKFWGVAGEQEFLTIYTDIEKPSWMMNPNAQVDITKLTNATLTYPTQNGTHKTINLSINENAIKNDFVALSHHPWSHCEGAEQPCEPDRSKMNITNHVSGDYTIQITYDGESVSKTFKNIFVLRDATGFTPELTSPLAYPQWPEALNNLDWENQQNWSEEQQQIQQSFQSKQDKFLQETDNKGYTSFATNFDSNEDGTNDAIKDIIFKWNTDDLDKKIADANLPENIVPAYQVGINLVERKDTNGDGQIDYADCNGEEEWKECNTEIYNTWWDNRPIQSNSFKLPIPLKENSEEGEYNINVELVFIDKTTGKDIGRGGHTYASFKVGSVGEITGNEQIIFSGQVQTENNTTLSENTKVALIKEQCTFDATTFEHQCHSTTIQASALDENSSYALSVNAKEIQEALDNKGHFNLITFEDKNNNNQWDAWKYNGTDEENQNAETAWWPQNKHFWFDNWGDFRINVEEFANDKDEFKHQSYKIKSEENVEIDNFNFEVFNWIY
ncbi:MAG: hypothetical protein K0U47_05310 [Epsilonproteobacteria bacterium]|nr:hypothetical protein [Campylobacterota bacterium]